MRGTVKTTALAAAVVAVVGAGLVSPGTAYADSPNIYTTDTNRGGMAYFLSSLNNSDREQIAVYDRRSSESTQSWGSFGPVRTTAGSGG